MRILITSGGTEEPIDGVRYITNFSTGRTGAVIADYLAACGVETVLVHGRHAVLPETDMERYSFTTFTDLDRIQPLMPSSIVRQSVISRWIIYRQKPEKLSGRRIKAKSVPQVH